MPNTGFYIINPNAIKFIPKNKTTDINDLIKIIKSKNYKIGTYLIPNKSCMTLVIGLIIKDNKLTEFNEKILAIVPARGKSLNLKIKISNYFVET